MTAFAIALVVGVTVAVAYVFLALRAFIRTRRAIVAGVPVTPANDATYIAQGRGLVWKGGLGALASVAVLVAISTASFTWYLVPFLAIGSSIAVIVAFLVDDD